MPEVESGTIIYIIKYIYYNIIRYVDIRCILLFYLYPRSRLPTVTDCWGSLKSVKSLTCLLCTWCLVAGGGDERDEMRWGRDGWEGNE